MPFTKGKSGNPAGMKKGTVTKVGHDINQNLAWFLQSKFKTLVKNFDKLSPKDQMRFYLLLMPYTVLKRDEIPFHKMDDSDLDTLINCVKEADFEMKKKWLYENRDKI